MSVGKFKKKNREKKYFLPRLRERMKVGDCATGFLALTVFVLLLLPSGYAEKPSRIVSMNLCTDELLVRLAEPERIAAITYFSADTGVSNISAEASRFHLIRSQAEEVMSLNPDLVFAGQFTERSTVALLRQLGYPVYLLELPRDFEGIRKNIRELARLVGEEARGRQLIQAMDAALAGLPPAPEGTARAIFYQRGGYTPGAETFEDAILRAAGAENISATNGIRHYGILSLEKLIAESPDLIVFSEFDKNRRSVGGGVLEHPALRRSPKIRTVTLPARWLNCGGPSSVEAVRELRKAFAQTK